MDNVPRTQGRLSGRAVIVLMAAFIAAVAGVVWWFAHRDSSLPIMTRKNSPPADGR